MKSTAVLCALMLLGSTASSLGCDKAEKASSDDDDGSSKKRKKKRKKSKRRAFDPGAKVTLRLRLAAADKKDFACAGSELPKGVSCALPSADVDSPTPEPGADTLQPFTALDGRRFLIAGVWSQPVVNEIVSKNDARFVTSCAVTMLDEAKGVKVRSFPSAPWVDAKETWIARVDGCTVADKDKPKPKPLPAPHANLDGSRVFIPLASYSPRQGPKNAAVSIVVYTDYQ